MFADCTIFFRFERALACAQENLQMISVSLFICRCARALIHFIMNNKTTYRRIHHLHLWQSLPFFFSLRKTVRHEEKANFERSLWLLLVSFHFFFLLLFCTLSFAFHLMPFVFFFSFSLLFIHSSLMVLVAFSTFNSSHHFRFSFRFSSFCCVAFFSVHFSRVVQFSHFKFSFVCFAV